MGLRVLEAHTVPVWEEPDGTRRLGMGHEPDPPPVVGWANVLVIEIDGGRHELLAVPE